MAARTPKPLKKPTELRRRYGASAAAQEGFSPEDIEEFRRRADDLRAGEGIPWDEVKRSALAALK